MSLVSKFTGGKRVNFSKGVSYGTRAQGAALSHFYGPSWHLKTWSKLHGKPVGIFTQKVCRKKQKKYAQIKPKKLMKKGGPDEHYGPDACPSDDMLEEDFKNASLAFLQKQQQSVDTHKKWCSIEVATRGQHTNQLWRSMRKNLLTASNFGAVIKRRISTPCHNLVKRLLYATAIEMYETKTHNSVQKCGLFVDIKNPFLAASPDGLIGNDGLVEIKCLPSIGDSKMRDIEHKNLCFEVINETIRLKRNHSYYYQVQGQLNISQRQFCDFVMYSNNDFFVERILVDKNLWTEHMLPKLIYFYKECILPEIIDGRIPRNLKAREPVRVD
ncbi:hypothetical protein RN001_006178 [Aquatica leii]|uniref:YqaJ viral recombinase domain-containing protein n=1 Tax=Aquatica leii TaxID=1421715 RepID=A0AAN7Q1G3_9COLE|nr:hypothetical protein RN001_006178 [Aquatica leii]